MQELMDNPISVATGIPDEMMDYEDIYLRSQFPELEGLDEVDSRPPVQGAQEVINDRNIDEAMSLGDTNDIVREIEATQPIGLRSASGVLEPMYPEAVENIISSQIGNAVLSKLEQGQTPQAIEAELGRMLEAQIISEAEYEQAVAVLLEAVQ